jgi:tetratricopeptide (TPR) repeat protein
MAKKGKRRGKGGGAAHGQGPSAPANTGTPAALKASGNAAFQELRLHHAIDLYTKAIQAAPSEAVYYANRSAALFEAGEYSRALVDIGSALQRSPDAVLAAKLALRAARCALWQGGYQAAQQWLDHTALNGTAAVDSPESLQAVLDKVPEVARHVVAAERSVSDAEQHEASAELQALARGTDASAPGLVRDLIAIYRGELYASSHDPPKSLLAGAKISCQFVADILCRKPIKVQLHSGR